MHCLGWSQLPTSCLFYTWQCIYVNPALPVHLTLLFPACAHISLYLEICVLQIQRYVDIDMIDIWIQIDRQDRDMYRDISRNISVLYIYVSIPALQTGTSVPSFQIWTPFQIWIYEGPWRAPGEHCLRLEKYQKCGM